MKYETHEISVCTDCLMLIANGEVSDDHPDNRPDDDQDNNASSRHANKINAIWPFENGWHLSIGDDHTEFSWRRCEGCGSRLGGDREQAFAMRSITLQHITPEPLPTRK